MAPLLAGCNEPTAATAARQAAEPEVGIVTVRPQPRAVVRELPGRIAPTRVSEVRPRVSGIMVERLFHQGSEVKAGDPLYRIDPQPFEVEVQSSRSRAGQGRGGARAAAQHARRIATLTSQRAAPEAENEKAIARRAPGRGRGRRPQGRRRARQAQSRLRDDPRADHGVVGAALVSEGALVVQNETTSLATIQQLDPIYADFTQSVTELNKLRRAFESGDLDRIAPDAAKVRLVLDDGTVYPLDGKLLFSEAKVDAYTGQVTLRGEFANPKRELLPGMYVRVLIEQGIDTDAIAVPQQAIQRNGGGGSEVFVVKDDDRVAMQPVRTGAVQDGLWLVTDGLKAGDQRRGRRLPEIRARRQGQAASVDRGGCLGRTNRAQRRRKPRAERHMPSFFIDRPIFAWVVALFICLIGAISIPLLAVAQYPIIAPPSISISTSYPGASPENLYNSVTRLIEEELNGASGILNFESTSDSLGQVEIIANFVPGTETGAASVEVQNRIKRVEARLPRAVIQQGILVEEASSAVLQIITLNSTDGSLDEIGLGDFMIRNVLGEIRRIPGVGRATLYSTERRCASGSIPPSSSAMG